MDPHKVVSHDEWLAARKALLVREKQFARLRDRLTAERQALPWTASKSPTCSTRRTANRRSPASSPDAAS